MESRWAPRMTTGASAATEAAGWNRAMMEDWPQLCLNSVKLMLDLGFVAAIYHRDWVSANLENRENLKRTSLR